MDRFIFWQRWLFVVGLAVSVFGVALALLNATSLFAVMHHQVNPVFFMEERICADARAFQMWSYGVLGAVVAGWGVALAFVAHYPFKNKEPWAWNCVATGLLLWYVIDTGISAYFKVYFNVLFNTGMLVAALLPLVLTRKQFVR